MVEFLSDYEEQPDGSVFVEFDGPFGRNRHLVSKEEADKMVADNERYNAEHQTEVDEYLRSEQAYLDECDREYFGKNA